jgi:hypothetical protein
VRLIGEVAGMLKMFEIEKAEKRLCHFGKEVPEIVHMESVRPIGIKIVAHMWGISSSGIGQSEKPKSHLNPNFTTMYFTYC